MNDLQIRIYQASGMRRKEMGYQFQLLKEFECEDVVPNISYDIDESLMKLLEKGVDIEAFK